MTITYKKGDLFTTDATVIVHGCNAQGVMGSGIAKQMKEIYPYAYETYVDVHRTNGLELGEIQIVPVDWGNKIVINAITQEFYGRDGKQYADYEAIRTCMSNLRDIFLDGQRRSLAFNFNKIAMPKIGCGLGGLNWLKVEKIIREELSGIEVEVWEL